ncbi:hypothetical protein EKD04_017860 [Chloroflexales bacterium ZM16-3]|nr:hypothetical protein [Chloroflexales bacterium ZM16-3]
MTKQTIAVAADSAAGRAAWARRVTELGAQPIPVPLRSPLPTDHVDLWVVILDAHTLPISIAFWLRQIRARIVLITPHLPAGQSLAQIVPALCLVCAPPQASAGIADVLALAESIRSGVIALTLPAQVSLCAR